MNDSETTELLREISRYESQNAFRTLVNKYYELVYRHVTMYMRQGGDIDEAVSDTFYAIWRNRRNLDQVKSFKCYVLQISKFKAIDQLRRRNRFRTVDEDNIDIDSFVNTITSPEDKIISSETIEEINRAINTLPPKCKLAFKLIREDEMTYKEASDFLNVSEKTVESHICNAMKKLRSVLKTAEKDGRHGKR